MDQTIDGVLLVDKAPDMTSHDVVAIARRTLNTKKIGHCGTLDPMATGLLILVIGKGTKMQDLLMAEDKEYEGALTLGRSTTTHDKEGETVEEKDFSEVDGISIGRAFSDFKGDFHQIPPMVSAVKKDGVRLYKLARKGQEVERDPRLVHVYTYEIQEAELPDIRFRVVCSKGFYVRTYAHDIGIKLGCGAHLSDLRRTRSGRFTLAKAVPTSVLKEGDREEILENYLLSLPEVSRLRGA
ncbi:MAG: tRNA pseudouridine(55) synthase TruB [Verrucomicrobiota bacterium]